jgi:hypothetical protein
MNRFLSLTVAAALAMGFVACSDDENMLNTNPFENVDGAYLQFVINVPGTTTSSRYTDTETTGQYDTSESFPEESVVNAVYAYFTVDGSSFVKFDTGKYYAKYSVSKVTTSTVTEGNASATYQTSPSPITSALYTALTNMSSDQSCKVYLLCNKPAENVSTVSDLMQATFDFADGEGLSSSITETGIPMSARSIDGTYTATLAPTEDNKSAASPFVLNFEVERSFARIYFTGTNSIPLYDDVADPNSSDGTNNGIDVAGGTQIGTIELMSYYIVNEANKYYVYRHVGQINGAFEVTLPTANGATDYATMLGPITETNPFLAEPNSSSKTNTATFATGFWNMYNWAYSHESSFHSFMEDREVTQYNASGQQVTTTLNLPATTYKGVEYVAENTMGKEAQLKSHATGVIFKVQLVPTTIYHLTQQNKQDAISTTSYAGSDYAPVDLYYYNKKFYDDLNSVALDNNLTELTESNYSTDYGVKCYKGGVAYYDYFIRHNNNNKYTVMADMEFAIVRNNSYNLNIKAAAMSPYQSIYGGEPPYDDPQAPFINVEGPKVDIPDPDFPGSDTPTPCEESNIYLQVDINVRPWIVNPYIGITLGDTSHMGLQTDD